MHDVVLPMAQSLPAALNVWTVRLFYERNEFLAMELFARVLVAKCVSEWLEDKWILKSLKTQTDTGLEARELQPPALVD